MRFGTLECPGLVALQHEESSQTRDRTCVHCIGRRILIHWTTRKSPTLSLALSFLLLYFFLSPDPLPSPCYHPQGHLTSKASQTHGGHQSDTSHTHTLIEKSCCGLKQWRLLSPEGDRAELMQLSWVISESRLPSLILGHLHPSISTEVMPIKDLLPSGPCSVFRK